MLVAALVFTAMGALVKLVSDHHTAMEVVAWRGGTGAVLMGGWMLWRGARPGSPHLRMVLSRSLVGTLALGCWFVTLGTLPLATSVTLNYTAPLFIALLAPLGAWLGWQWLGAEPRADTQTALQTQVREASQTADDSARTTGHGWLTVAILASFVGVLLILRPTIDRGREFDLALGLFSGLLSAVAYLQVRTLGRVGEPEWRVVFWFSLVNLAFGAAIASFTGWHTTTLREVLLLVSIGVLAALGQLLMTYSFGQGRTLFVANLQYTGVIFATLIGWFWFGDTFEWIEAAGIALIVLSGLAASTSSVKGAPARHPASTQPNPRRPE